MLCKSHSYISQKPEPAIPQNINMAQENERPVFFFDIDNCVSTYLILHESELANFIEALPEECVFANEDSMIATNPIRPQDP